MKDYYFEMKAVGCPQFVMLFSDLSKCIEIIDKNYRGIKFTIMCRTYKDSHPIYVVSYIYGKGFSQMKYFKKDGKEKKTQKK